jgi:hypothetical protein
MNLPEKFVAGLVAATTALAIAVVGLYWWSRTPPRRPQSLPPSAVFLWAPKLGVPAKPRGLWLTCRFNPTHNADSCSLTNLQGQTTYEGIFVPDENKSPIPEAALIIDEKHTNQSWPESAVWIGDELVPLIHLQNGAILIPEEGYEAGKAHAKILRKPNSTSGDER